MTTKPQILISFDEGEGSVKGLHLRTNPSGRKSYYLLYSAKGVQRRPKIGDLPECDLELARGIARDWLKEVLRGNDPSLDRKKQRNEKTVQEVFEFALAEHWSDEKFLLSGRQKENERLYNKELKKRFGTKSIKEITAPLIREWHRLYKSKPSLGNSAKSVLSKLLSLAEEKGWREPQSNPCFSIPNFKESQRERVATPEELKKIVGILEREKENYPREVAFLYLLMFTGSRPRAIERALRSQISEQEFNGEKIRVITFEGKTGREVVVIPQQAMAALLKLPVRKDGLLVGIKSPRKLWIAVREEAGCPDLWARDFRRTFASIGLGAGVPIDKIGRALNHKSQQTTLIYARLAETARIQTASTIADAITSVLETDKLQDTGSD